MSGSSSNGAQSSVQDWLDGQYEYIVPDKDSKEHRGKASYIPRDAYRDHTPEVHDEGSSTLKSHRHPRDQQHSTAKDRYTPATPPSEDGLERERDRHRHGSDQERRRDRDLGVDREERRPHRDRGTRYPPKADHGRPARPAPNRAATTPYLTAGQAPRDKDPGRTRQGDHSQPTSPLRHRDDKPTRSQHSRRNNADRSPSPPPPRPSKRRDSRDRDGPKDHHGNTGGGSSTTTTTTPRRPSLSRSQTAPHGRDPVGKTGNPPHRSFSFLHDPRFVSAAEAALRAGATAALAPAGPGGDRGAKVLGASLSAAALSALRSPAPTSGSEPPPAPPTKPRGTAVERAGDRAGGYVAGHEGGGRGSKRRYHY